jgi:hypothetical protein
MEGSELTAYIQKFSLLECPDYDTLSYVWGDGPSRHRIDVNHRQILILPNLFHALLRMRGQTMPVFLWVGSLCIDQSNEMERTAQVGRMAEIYQNAKSVKI